MLFQPEGMAEIPEWGRRWTQRFEGVCTEAHASSDRACAIVMVAVIEELLRSLLTDYLPATSVKLNALASPGNVRRLVDLGEAVGLFYGKLADSLRCINDVRNRFAHRVLDDPGFSSEEMRDVVERLQLPFEIDGSGFPTQSGRERFMAICGVCFIVLVMQHSNLSRLEVQNGALASLKIDLDNPPFPIG